MKSLNSNQNQQLSRSHKLLLLTICALAITGCRGRLPRGGTEIGFPTEPLPLGSYLDQINQTQEDNAEAAKFVIYMHEFELNKPEWEHRLRRPYEGPRRGFRLTPYGQDHVRRIASQLLLKQEYPVIVERNNTSIRESTEYKYSVHNGDDLDLERRKIVVQALQMLGVEDADSRVIIAPAFSEGLDSEEAASAYGVNHQASRGGSNQSQSGGGTGF